MDRVEALVEAVVELEEEKAVALVEELLTAGASPSVVIQAACTALEIVGERYARQEYFLSALIVAGEIFRNILGIVEPEPGASRPDRFLGKVLLGTVEGDIHDLGKNMAATALTAAGFTVRDLGVDVSPGRFAEEAREFGPDIVGLSGLLIPVAATAMRRTAEAVRAEADREGKTPFIIIGGNVDKAIADYVGADSWTTDAMEGARICQRLMETEEWGQQ